jgi:hypothetical protein
MNPLQATVLDRMQAMPIAQQQEIVDFVESLHTRASVPTTRRSIRGLGADLGATLTETDLTELRQEMWHRFPREAAE